MEMELQIVGDSFFVFDPDRDVDALLPRIHSAKILVVLRYWLSLRKGEKLPGSADIDPAAIKSALPHVMITGISYDPFRVLYRLVGTEIVRWARFDFTNRYADELIFQDDAVDRIADFATIVNERTENIGARRLHTVMEKLLDEISFEGPDLVEKTVTIDDAYVTKMLSEIVKNEDLSRYIL